MKMTNRKKHHTKPRPEKPEGSPLFPHRNGQWARKIKGKTHYFGSWDEYDAALERHNYEYDYLREGTEVPADPVIFQDTIANLLNSFLEYYERKVETKDIERITFEAMQAVAKLILKSIPRTIPLRQLNSEHLERLRAYLIGRTTPENAKVQLGRVRSIFKWGIKQKSVDPDKLDMSESLRSPSARSIRQHNNNAIDKLLTGDQFRDLIDRATLPIKAMLYLGANCGFNISDVRFFEFRHFEGLSDDLEGWIKYPRRKTQVRRFVKLWPETRKAIEAYRSVRPEPRSPKNQCYLFVTQTGRQQWQRWAVSQEIRKIRDSSLCPDFTFAWCRKTLQTLGEGTGDFVATQAVMGHVVDGISSRYRQLNNAEFRKRLVAVTDHIRGVLLES